MHVRNGIPVTRTYSVCIVDLPQSCFGLAVSQLRHVFLGAFGLRPGSMQLPAATNTHPLGGSRCHACLSQLQPRSSIWHHILSES
jgi:hypothetical protein